jgi:5,10-methylenetetrahydromethanopterin reductase
VRRIGIAFNGLPYSVRQMTEAVVECEAAGFESAWQAEDVYGPDVVVPLACYAYVTRRILLGTCVTNPNTRAVTILANTFATLDQVSSGRMILGLGAGLTWLPLIGKAPADVRSLTLMRETLSQFRSILDGNDLMIDGKPATLFGRSVSLPAAFNWPFGGFEYPRKRIPVYLGARGPKMIEAAGEIADGLVCEHSWPVPAIQTWTSSFQDAVRDAGRDPAELDCVGLVLMSPSEEGHVDSRIKLFLVNRMVKVTPEQADAWGLDRERLARIQGLMAEGEETEASQLVTTELAGVFGAIGTPEQCLARLEEYASAGLTVPRIFPQACDLHLAIEIGAQYAQGGLGPAKQR